MTNIFQFASSFNSLALNDTELGLFCAVVLLTPERNGVTDIKSVQHHQDRLLEALKVQVMIKTFGDLLNKFIANVNTDKNNKFFFFFH